jgi:hypothetical protein
MKTKLRMGFSKAALFILTVLISSCATNPFFSIAQIAKVEFDCALFTNTEAKSGRVYLSFFAGKEGPGLKNMTAVCASERQAITCPPNSQSYLAWFDGGATVVVYNLDNYGATDIIGADFFNQRPVLREVVVNSPVALSTGRIHLMLFCR